MRFRRVVPVLMLAAALAAVSSPTAAQPVPSVSDTLLDFGNVPFTTTDVLPFWVHNSGDASLISIITSSDPFRFAISTGFVVVSPGDSAQVDVTFNPSLPGSYAEVITLANFSAVPETLTVDVIGNGAVISPMMSVTPPSLSVTINENETTNRSLFVENTGGGTLEWNAEPQAFWITTTPSSGSTGSGIVREVIVTFDSDGFPPVSNNSSIRFTSNAGSDTLVVPVTMIVVGQPEIDVVPTARSFGRVYQGFSLDRTFTVFNQGTNTLNVSSISVSGNPDFTVDTGPFSLPLNTSKVVTVTLTPTGNGLVTGNVEIASDDLDEPLVVVALDGEESSLSPPIMSVPTDTIAASLTTGEMTTRILPINNPGGDDLIWSLDLAYAGTQPLSGLQVLVDHSHETSPFFTNSSIFVNAMTDSGVVWTENFGPITSGRLVRYDVLYVPNQSGGVGWTQAEANVVRDYVLAGGSLFLDTRFVTSVNNANLLMSTLGTGMAFRFGANTSAMTTLIIPSEITEGIDQLWLERSVDIYQLFPPGQLIAWYSGGTRRFAAFAEIGDGRVVGAADRFHRDDRVTVFGADNLLLATQMFEWLGSTTPGLSVDKASGVLAAGAADTITVTFDATLVSGGDYFSNVVFSSNDPLNQSFVVPAAMHVTGTSRIAASDTVVNFDDRLVGTSQVVSIDIRNTGLDTLLVTAIVPPDSIFTAVAAAGAPPFALPGGDSTVIDITFAPLSPGMHTGSLLILNSSANAETLTVALSGTGVEMVDLMVSPDSIHVTMPPDTTRPVGMTVSNSGSRAELLIGAVHETTGGAFQPNVFFDNFENADFAGWNVVASSGTKQVLGNGGGAGSIFNYTESNAQQGHRNGIYQLFPGLQPRAMSFWVRPDQSNAFSTYVTLLDGANREAIFFFATSAGTFYINDNVGGNQTYPYTAGQWYHVEYRDIDWTAKTFDYVVNDSLVQADVPLRNAASVNEVSRLDLYHFDTGASGSWDHVWVDYTSRPAWLGVSPLNATVAPDSAAAYQLTFDTHGLAVGAYSALVSIATNDPISPLMTVPVALSVDSLATAIDPLPFRPRAYALFQNYPNPFNPSTTISFDLPRASVTRLEIYNVRGQRILALETGRRPAGRHSVEWDGLDSAGLSVASGVYFYRLVAGPFVQTRKMLLLK